MPVTRHNVITSLRHCGIASFHRNCNRTVVSIVCYRRSRWRHGMATLLSLLQEGTCRHTSGCSRANQKSGGIAFFFVMGEDVPSSLAEANCNPSGAHATAQTTSVWPCSVAMTGVAAIVYGGVAARSLLPPPPVGWLLPLLPAITPSSPSPPLPALVLLLAHTDTSASLLPAAMYSFPSGETANDVVCSHDFVSAECW